MKSKPFQVSLLILVFLVGACSSTRPPALLSSDNLPGTYVLFGFKMVNQGSMDKLPSACKLELIETNSQKRIRINIKQDQNIVLAPIESETYRFNELDCGSGFHYKITNMFGTPDGQLSAQDDKINFIGYSEFLFGKNGELGFQWKANASTNFLKKIYPKMSKTAQTKLVNAFTGKDITAEILNASIDKRNFGINYTKNSESSTALINQVMKSFKENLQRCINEEEKNNPLRVGKLFFKVSYDDMKIKNLLALDLNGAKLSEHQWNPDTCLLVGEEGAGLPVLRNAQKMTIPTIGVESLNATVAASIAMYSYSQA
jgi:tRNA(Leu) C34 or U34 (ribose-2'-O)-methylase TrmL